MAIARNGGVAGSLACLTATIQLGGCTSIDSVAVSAPATQIFVSGESHQGAVELAASAAVSLRPELGVRPSARAGWSRVPSQRLIDTVYPHLASGAGFAEIDCSVGADRALRDCRITEIQPNNRGFETAFLRLASAFKLADSSPRPEQIRVVMLTLQLWDRLGTAPCNPPFCVRETFSPPPPPPPPPHH